MNVTKNHKHRYAMEKMRHVIPALDATALAVGVIDSVASSAAEAKAAPGYVIQSEFEVEGGNPIHSFRIVITDRKIARSQSKQTIARRSTPKRRRTRRESETPRAKRTISRRFPLSPRAKRRRQGVARSTQSAYAVIPTCVDEFSPLRPRCLFSLVIALALNPPAFAQMPKADGLVTSTIVDATGGKDKLPVSTSRAIAVGGSVGPVRFGTRRRPAARSDGRAPVSVCVAGDTATARGRAETAKRGASSGSVGSVAPVASAPRPVRCAPGAWLPPTWVSARATYADSNLADFRKE